MLVSYKLLQTFFTKKLPKPEAIAEELTFHAFEIEGMEKKGSDVAIDVKVLPNRAHDCLSHEGIAREIGAIMDIPFRPATRPSYPKPNKKNDAVSAQLKDKRAQRYIALTISGVKVGPSPKWLKDYLATLGQRSINNIVDATNYVMFVTGQPLHAFDRDKLSGEKIIVRPGKEGESLVTLDGKDVRLDPEIMVIADAKEPLAIAGIKGGTKAEVDSNTRSLVLESANFDASTIRLTAQRIGIKTDASKRFESGLSPYVAEDAMRMVAQLILELAGNTQTTVSRPVDLFPRPPKPRSVSVTQREITRVIGIPVSDVEIRRVWKKLGLPCQVKKTKTETTYTILVPHSRLDLSVKEDLVEEVGRLRGYHDLPALMPVEMTQAPEENIEWKLRECVRSVMLGAGFSDVYTYAFLGQGEIEVANPIASDKKYLRNNLMNGLKLAVLENLKYESEVRIFEFGHIFGKTDAKIKEEHSFAALMGFAKRKDAERKEDFLFLKGVLEQACAAIGVEDLHFEEAGGELVASISVMECSEGKKEFSKTVIGTMSASGFEMDFSKLVSLSKSRIIYRTPSRFPSIIRDVSLFVPLSTRAGDVQSVIRTHAGALVRSVSLIDVFAQPEQQRKSLAFRMVLQSDDRTLSDDEANALNARVIAALESVDGEWQVRK